MLVSQSFCMLLNTFQLNADKCMCSSLSDIVRDFTLASRTSVELQELQQPFISTLISSIAAKSGDNQLHTALNTYATSSLAYHVRVALSTPLASDGLASTLLFHVDPSIVAQWCVLPALHLSCI